MGVAALHRPKQELCPREEKESKKKETINDYLSIIHPLLP